MLQLNLVQPIEEEEVIVPLPARTKPLLAAHNEIIRSPGGKAYISLSDDCIRLVIGESTVTITETDILLDSPHIGLNDDRPG